MILEGRPMGLLKAESFFGSRLRPLLTDCKDCILSFHREKLRSSTNSRRAHTDFVLLLFFRFALTNPLTVLGFQLELHETFLTVSGQAWLHVHDYSVSDNASCEGTVTLVWPSSK